jgi:hypothetical protein
VALPLTKSFEGLKQTYPGLAGVVAYCAPEDYAAPRKAFLDLPSPATKVFLGAPAGPGARVLSLLNLMAYAKRVEAKCVLTIDANLATVKRTWIGRLAEPVLSGQAALTAPFYHSLKFDTPVTTLFAYPLFRALFGRRLRQPFRCDRAFSAGLNELLLAHDGWRPDGPYAMAEMTTSLVAIANGAKICQAFMGNPRVGAVMPPLDPTAASLFIEAAGSLFELVSLYPDLWGRVARSRPTPVTGTDLAPPVIPSRTLASPNQFLESLRGVVARRSGFWSDVFGGAYDHVYRSLAYDDYKLLTVDCAEWANLVFDSALAWRRLDAAGRQALLEALSAVFLGRLLAWIRDAAGLTLAQVEARGEEEARVFETAKSRLAAGWS